MNIQIATDTFNKALTAAATGDHFKSASLFLDAMRYSSQCSSSKREDIFFYSHVGSVMQSKKVLETSDDQRERSESGRIKSESYTRFHRGI